MVVIGHGGGGCAWYPYPSSILCHDYICWHRASARLGPFFELPGRNQVGTMANWSIVCPKTPWKGEKGSICN